MTEMLTVETIRKIRLAARDGKKSIRQIAKDFNVSVYADFISELEQLPGMDVSMKKVEQFKAAEMRAAG